MEANRRFLDQHPPDARRSTSAKPTTKAALPHRFRSALSMAAMHSDQDELAKHIKPGLYFYKFLQPVGGRRLELNIPDTVLCESSESAKEDVLWLVTDASGHICCVDRPINWKRKFIADITVPASTPAPVDPSDYHAHYIPKPTSEDVLAVRKMSSTKPFAPPSTTTIAIPKRHLDRILQSDTKKLGYVVQKYIRCRGINAAFYRAVWVHGSQNPYALYILNNNKFSDYARPTAERAHELELHDTSLEVATDVAKYYCASSTALEPSETNGGVPFVPDLHASKLRGPPIQPALDAVARIVQHVQHHIPCVKFDEMAVDFIKDIDGKWWFLQVQSFHYKLRTTTPPDVSDVYESLVSIPKRLSLRTKEACAKAPKAVVSLPSSMLCFLCHETFALSLDDVASLGLVLDDDDHMKLATNVSGYIMTFKMVLDTICGLRQRGVYMHVWEASVALQRGLNQQLVLSNECRVCFVCYQIYKHQVRVTTTARTIHAFFHADPTHPPPPVVRIDGILARILEARREHDVRDFTYAEQALAKPRLSAVRGTDVDPSCDHFCVCLFFHEVQDVALRTAVATDYVLEYQLGQAFCKLSFDGPKFHSIHRWQLCEARLHYVLASPEAFTEYCVESKIHVKLKTRDGVFAGHAFMSLKPLLLAAHAAMTSDEADANGDETVNPRRPSAFPRNCSCDVLVPLKTHDLGLLKLKVTLGLIASQDDFANYRAALEDLDVIQESNVYWPQLSYFKPSVVLPIEWMTLLTSSEYVSHTADISQSIDESVALNILTLPHEPASPKEEKKPDEKIRNHDRDMQPPLATVRHVVFRLAGNVETFPALLLGHLLRSVSFGKLTGAKPRAASWRAPATLRLTAHYTLDTIFAGLVKAKPSRLEPIAVFGELILLLLATKRIPRVLSLKALEATFSPYWLQRTASVMDPLPSHVDDAVLLSKRVLWNRAVRRCQLAGFGNPSMAFVARLEWPGHIPPTQVLHRKRSLRTRLRLLAYAQMFELVESNDSGYLDIGEFRCLPQSMGSHSRLLKKRRCTRTMPDFVQVAPGDVVVAPTSPVERRSSLKLSDAELNNASQPLASMALLHAWDDRLFSCVITAFEATLASLVQSAQFQAAFAHFDEFGSGGYAYHDFWLMAENALQDGSGDRQRVDGFCLRHGLTEMYANDYVCVHCDFDYLDPFFLEASGPTRVDGPVAVKTETADEDGDNDEDETPAVPRLRSLRFNPSDFCSQIMLEAAPDEPKPHRFLRQHTVDLGSLPSTRLRHRKSSSRRSSTDVATFDALALAPQPQATEVDPAADDFLNDDDDDDDDSSLASAAAVVPQDDEEDDDQIGALSYFKHVESNFITKAFEDKVEHRIARKYAPIQSVATLDHVTRDEVALHEMLELLEAAEKELHETPRKPQLSPKPKRHLQKSASAPDTSNQQPFVRASTDPATKKLDAKTQARLLERLCKPPNKRMQSSASYANLLQKEMARTGKTDVLRSIARMEAKRRELDDKVADEIQGIREQLASLHASTHRRNR
ncbi:hypothetical protein SDRG_00706 [Saprolegnia diclina VS20]|uniref:EF-hand domain-containing protein n=1 Tax=Saprolegnia diclina (strain VS20) TaxID=1156394 RepID=T0QUG4_SAPDV|nr:hypothetical protein SDRG_00706 [Saprolegnia diclina VS20]EQC41849.1 hypothetical protein SDRG_00706 [Saprolegnia diclina VS20]|eukprot:XP_008604418.1 hypothetical protein SDRG_00706 [Saprolegnia diclina VS20]